MLRDDTRLRKWTVGEKAGNRFPLADVFSWRVRRVLHSALAKSNLYCGCRLLDWSGNRADCPILVKYQKICEGHLRFYLRSPRQMTQAGACILAGSEACPSKSSQLFPETGFYFFSSWRSCLCLVGGLFLLIIVFSWNLDMEYIIYLMEQTPHMGTGEKRRMAVGRALNQGWGRC